jgi:hypothetical protein
MASFARQASSIAVPGVVVVMRCYAMKPIASGELILDQPDSDCTPFFEGFEVATQHRRPERRANSKTNERGRQMSWQPRPIRFESIRIGSFWIPV